MQRYLLDTNILIYYFNGEMDSTVENRVSLLMAESFQISVISKMEFLGFSFAAQEKQRAIEFMNYAAILMLDAEIVQRVIVMRQEKRIKLPDAIIAATAMQYSVILVTRNVNDFKNLALDVYNPFAN